ncbi:MAG TPA: hypothetical protein G4O10_06720 [Dehalococcoidia bacterium]|nr:hypothetical protein [Dehalococcoidia bacterium]
MTEVTHNQIGNIPNPVRIIIGILVFGSIWGLLEATLGGLLNLVIFPNKGAIMGGIGMVVMGAALAVYRKPAMLPGIGIVAASFKWLNAWLLFVPPSAVQIINPAISIVFEALAFSLVVAFLMDRIEKNVYVGVWAAALAGLMSAIAYVYFAVYMTNSPIFARLGIESIEEYIIGSGLVQAVFFGVLAPLGYVVGKRLTALTSPVLTRRPVYYAVSTSAVIFCFGFSALAIMAGL